MFHYIGLTNIILSDMCSCLHMFVHNNMCIGWATSVSAGSQKGGSGFMFFDIIVDLTTEGEGKRKQLLEM